MRPLSSRKSGPSATHARCGVSSSGARERAAALHEEPVQRDRDQRGVGRRWTQRRAVRSAKRERVRARIAGVHVGHPRERRGLAVRRRPGRDVDQLERTLDGRRIVWARETKGERRVRREAAEIRFCSAQIAVDEVEREPCARHRMRGEIDPRRRAPRVVGIGEAIEVAVGRRSARHVEVRARLGRLGLAAHARPRARHGERAGSDRLDGSAPAHGEAASVEARQAREAICVPCAGRAELPVARRRAPGRETDDRADEAMGAIGRRLTEVIERCNTGGIADPLRSTERSGAALGREPTGSVPVGVGVREVPRVTAGWTFTGPARAATRAPKAFETAPPTGARLTPPRQAVRRRRNTHPRRSPG